MPDMPVVPAPRAAQGCRELWNPSPPPPEDWEAEAAEQKWEYEGIVNEEVDVYGMTSYEVKWRNWHRNDAAQTNTTWHRTLPDMGNVQKKWDDKRAQERIALAEESLEMHIGLKPEQPWHEDITVEVQDAFKEKLAERRRKGTRVYSHWDGVRSITEYSDSESDANEDASRFSDPDVSM